MTDPQATRDRPRIGTCPACEYRIRLRKDGTMQRHAVWWKGPERTPVYCPGSYQMNKYQATNDAAREAAGR